MCYFWIIIQHSHANSSLFGFPWRHPISWSNKRNTKTGRTEQNTKENRGEWAGSKRNFIIHVNLQSSHLQHVSTSISEGHQSGKPSTWKVTFSSEGHQSGTAPTVSTSRVKGIFYTWLPVGGSHSTLMLVRHISAEKKTCFWRFIACQCPVCNHRGATESPESQQEARTSRRTRAAHSEKKVSAAADGGILLTKSFRLKELWEMTCDNQEC